MSDAPQQTDNVPEETVHADLGLAGRMARAFIHSPLSPLLLIASLAIGVLGLAFTPRQEDPQISVPMVDIFFQYPGASSEQVASLAVDPLERMMSEIPGVKHVYSASQRGNGMVTVEFDVGEDMEPSLVKLYDKLMSNMDKVPPGVSEPLVKPKGVDDVPVVTLTLWSEDMDDAVLRLVALDVLQRLKEVKNTSQSFVVGGRSEQIRVEILPERLSGFRVSVGQLAKTISSANSERETGYVESSEGSFTLHSGAFLKSAEDVKRLIIGVRDGSPVYVRDVALVSDGPAETRSIVRYFTGPAHDEGPEVREGAPAVTIAIAKKPGTNGVTVAQDVLDQVERLKGRVIPDNIHVAITRNYGETANDKVNELLFKLFVATGAVTLLVWFFLGFRAAMVVLIVIPVVILTTVFSAWILGYTIDRVSLFALIFSIGILVDDAIVVIENIYRRWLMKGEIDTETSVDAVREVGNPTILATFTVIGALLPMGFVSGMMGPYMRPIPVLGSVAMLFSLFAAFIFTPWLAMRIRPSLAAMQKAQDKEHRQSERLEGWFRRILVPLIQSPAKSKLFRLTMYGVLFACFAMFYTTAVSVKMLPLDNKPEFNVVINMPDGVALPDTANVAEQLSEKLLEIPEVTAVQSYVGTASPFNFNGLVRHYYLRRDPWHGDIQVQLLHKNDRERSSHEIADAARNVLTPIAEKLGARIQVVEMPPGPPVLQTVVAEIYGPDERTRRQVAADMTRMFEKAESVVDVDNLMQEPYPVWEFVVDREKAVRRGVSVEDINTQLEMAMGGFKVGDVKVGTTLEPRFIVIQLPMAIRSQFARLGELPVPTATGGLVPLAELGRFKRITKDPILFHKDLRPVEFVTGEVTGRLGAPIYGMLAIEDLLADYKAPDGVTPKSHYIGPPETGFESGFEWSGEWTVTYETFRDMGIAFAAALILIYMLVVWEFGNFRLPGIIMAPIPLTLIGIIPGHWLFDAPFTATSMIGFIALAGIIVRNSILLVDFSKKAVVEEGLDVREAVIQSCKARTRPIIITALALVAGSSVILTDPIFQGMAISLMFGAIISTLLTLVVIPLSCVKAEASFCPTDGTMAIPVSVGDAAEVEQQEAKPGWGAKIGTAVTMAFYAVRALFIFAWMGLKALASKFGVAGKLAMVFYALRALPFFLWLFIKESVKGLAARIAAPPPPPAQPAAANPGVTADTAPNPASSPAPATAAAPQPAAVSEPVVVPEATPAPAPVKPAPKRKAAPTKAVAKAEKKPVKKTAPKKAPKKAAAKSAPKKTVTKSVVTKTKKKTAAKPATKQKPKVAPKAAPAKKPTRTETARNTATTAKPKAKPARSAAAKTTGANKPAASRRRGARRGIRLKSR